MSSPSHHDPHVRKLFALQDSLKSRTDVPGDVTSAIDELVDLTVKKDNYVGRMTSENTEALKKNRKECFEHPWKSVYEKGEIRRMYVPHMISGIEEVQFIKSFLAGSKAKKVLELGLFTGYGALGMSEALPPDGVVVTCEIDPYLVKYVKKQVEGTPYAKKIQIMEGPALDSMEKLAKEGQKFDAIFIDADKENYPNYYQTIMDKNLLAEGGVILIDNALWLGSVYSGETRAGRDDVIRTNEMIRNDPRVHHVLLPLKDGLFIVRRKEDLGVC